MSLIGKTVSHYKILEKLGEGGMGVVYKAEDTRLKRLVALKFLSPQTVGGEEGEKRFVSEAQAAAALDHPNICTVYEIDQAEGQTFIAMAYLDGVSLKEKLDEKPLKLEDALDLAIQIAGGLQEAHEKKIVHRDMKSSNIMVTTKGQTKIMDFGLARQVGKTMITKEGTSMGTAAYMSPEQAQGEAVDHRTDIWSFGVILYEMLTGRLPFRGDYEQAVVYSILNEEAEPVTGLRTGIPMELERIVNKAMSKNREERYQNVNDMLVDLRAVRKGLEADTSTTGLTAAARLQKAESISPLKNLLQRRVPQILGGYILGGFVLIQFIDWLVSHYPVSPHLPEFSFAVLVSLIPTVLILAYFHGRSGRDQWTRVEKIGIPINLLLAAALLFVVFQDKELGATVKTLTVQDESGHTMERVIPKSGFRKSIAVFYFDNESGDSSLNWLQYAIPHMLTFDLYQDLFLDLIHGYLFYDKMNGAGFPKGTGLPLTLQKKIAGDLNKKYFITGSLNKQDDEFNVETSIYQTDRGKVLAENVFQGTDIFSLVDEISVVFKKELEIPEGHIEEVTDHPVAEILTGSLDALELYFSGVNSIVFDQNWEEGIEYLEQSVTEDPTFASAYDDLQLSYLLSNQRDKAIQASGKLMQHLYRLPERLQLQSKLRYYYDIKQDGEKGFHVAKLWADLYPDDLNAHGNLAMFYKLKNELGNAISEYQKILELDPERHQILQEIGSLYKAKGDFEEALEYYERYAEKFPDKYESFTALGELYRTLGEYEQAGINYERASIMEPENISVLLRLAAIEANLGRFEQALIQYMEALEMSKTPGDSSGVYRSLSQFHQTQGRINAALEYELLAQAIDERIRPQALVLLLKLQSLDIYILAEQKDVAFKTIETIEAQLSPPFDKLVSLGYLIIYVELEDADEAEKALAGVEEYMQTFQVETFRPVVFHAQGKIHEIRSEYEEAILSYQKELEIDPTDASIHRDIGRCYRELKDLNKAEASILKHLKIRPFDSESHSEIALVYHEMGQEKMALEHLNKALSIWEDADPEFMPAKEAREKRGEWESKSSN